MKLHIDPEKTFHRGFTRRDARIVRRHSTTLIRTTPFLEESAAIRVNAR